MSQRRFLAVGFTAMALACVMAGGSDLMAVVNGPLDGNNHPSVGFIFAQQSDPNTCNSELVSACSAILVSPTVAVTSGGCADSFSSGPFVISADWINFNPDNPFDCTTASRVDSIHLHPGFVAGQALSTGDLGVLVLAAPATVTPATLPGANTQGGYVKGNPFELVNWSGISKGNVYDNRRRFSPAEFTSGDADFLGIHITLNGGHICVGFNEGGGAFLPLSQNLSALLIDGSAGGCKNAQLLRLDTTNVRDFLDDYMTLP